MAIVFIIFLKFFIPVLMPFFPFQAVWANYFLDIVDGDVLQYLGLTDEPYQLIDKFADYISYIFMVVAGWKWRIRNTLLVLFVYRTIGQALFFVTGNEIYFFYFQNFLEPLMLIYTLFLFRTGAEHTAYKIYKKNIAKVWMIILVYKMWNEWYLHFANIDLSTIFFGFDGTTL